MRLPACDSPVLMLYFNSNLVATLACHFLFLYKYTLSTVPNSSLFSLCREGYKIHSAPFAQRNPTSGCQ